MAIHMRSRSGGSLFRVVRVPACILHPEEESEVNAVNNMVEDLKVLLGDPVPGATRDFSWHMDDDCVLVNCMGILLQAYPGMYIVVSQEGFPMVVSKEILDSTYEHASHRIVPDSSPIDKLLSMQKALEQAWGRLPDLTDAEAVSEYIRQTVLCTTDELHELLHEVHWKPWKEGHGIRDVEAYREELADVVHFVLDLYLAAGLTGDDLVNDYFSKHHENVRRLIDPAYKEGN